MYVYLKKTIQFYKISLRFSRHYRVNKAAFTYLLQMLTESLPPAKKKCAIPPIVKLSACLRFFAEGGYQKGVGRDYEVAMAQSTFSEVLSEFLNALEVSLCSKWISYPTREENRISAQEFYRKFGIPGVLGCIDGTHVTTIAPKEGKHLYYNRKGRFSLNVTLVSFKYMYVAFHRTYILFQHCININIPKSVVLSTKGLEFFSSQLKWLCNFS